MNAGDDGPGLPTKQPTSRLKESKSMIGDTKTFDFVYNGLNLQVIATDCGNDTSFVIKCLQGAADINALYWGDDVADKTNVDLGGSLNMNGLKLDWDGAIKLSDTGLGQKAIDGTSGAANKSTYLTTGETYTIKVTGLDWDNVDQLGVRATSTSTAEGSIKGVDTCAVVHTPPPPPTEHKGDLLFLETFDGYNNQLEHGTWGQVNLTAGSPKQPDGQVHYWAQADGNGGWASVGGEVVKGNAFPGSIGGSSTQSGDDFWLDTQNSPGGINISNWFHDPSGGKFLLEFDIGTHDFGTGPMEETDPNASFDVSIDGNVVAHFAHMGGGDPNNKFDIDNWTHDQMQHISLVLDGGSAAADHLITLHDTTAATDRYVGFAVDTIQVHDWVV